MATAKSIILGLKRVTGHELIHKKFGIIFYHEDLIETYLVRNFIAGEPDCLYLEPHNFIQIKNRVSDILQRLNVKAIDPTCLLILPRYEYFNYYPN